MTTTLSKEAWLAEAMAYTKTVLVGWTEEQLVPVCESVYETLEEDDDRSPTDAMIDEFECWTE